MDDGFLHFRVHSQNRTLFLKHHQLFSVVPREMPDTIAIDRACARLVAMAKESVVGIDGTCTLRPRGFGTIRDAVTTLLAAGA